MPEYSRLNNKRTRAARIQIILMVIGLVAVVLLLIKFGFPVIFHISDKISSWRRGTVSVKNTVANLEIPMTPILFPEYFATNSALVKINGKAESDSSVDIYLNGQLLESALADSYGDFHLELTLTQGINQITAKTTSKNNIQSVLSDPIEISFNTKQPKLEIITPNDNQTVVSELINFTGKTDPGNKILINTRAIIVGPKGEFSSWFRLQNGENKFKITAIDQTGNKIEKELTIKLNS